MQVSPVKAAALELGLRVETPEKSRSPEFVELLQREEADALIVAAYGQILSQKVLDAAKRGGINLHGSILPKYRGAAPIQRAILAGEDETGITLMQMDKGMDTGDIIDIARTPIAPDETYGELQDRLALIAADLIDAWGDRIAGGDYPRVPQNSELASHAPKVEKAEAELSCERPSIDEYNRYRAFTPSPGAWMQTSAGLLRISRMAKSEMEGEAGAILATSPGLVVAFHGGSLEFIEVQPEGKKRMSGKDFANGARLRPGSRLI
jgi:methionyl-tRNA formyltransferase